ncbi:hypothetical protein Tco_1448314 [Tanacetum coccineum]
MNPRSCLRWKPTGRIFKTVGLRWVPTGKIFSFSTTKVDSESPHGSNTDITNLHACIQNLDSSVGTSINVQEEQTLDLNAGTPFNLKKERIKVWIKENMISRRPRLHGTTLIQEISARPKRSYALSWKPCQGDSLNLPNHRIQKEEIVKPYVPAEVGFITTCSCSNYKDVP